MLDHSEGGKGGAHGKVGPARPQTHFHGFGLFPESNGEALKGFKLKSDVIRFMF